MSNERHDRRPWGGYTILGAGNGFQVKLIEIDAGKRLSYQRHEHRSEHWFIIRGEGETVLDGSRGKVGPGDSVDVPIGGLHRIGSSGDIPLVFVEVQLGDYLGEDDIERVEDDFGRA